MNTSASLDLLEIRGLLDASRLWPEGPGDADTLRVDVGGARGDVVVVGGAGRRPTRFLERAHVRGRPVLANGQVTVRLEGVDAPELHYRPQVSGASILRQHGGESAAAALRRLLSANGPRVPCLVRVAAHAPRDVCDVYGRVVGVVFIEHQGRELSLNHWLLLQGWALPSLYDGLPFALLRRWFVAPALRARAAGRGVWGRLHHRVQPFRALRFRHGGGSEPAAGLSVHPKLFRRCATWSALRRLGTVAEPFADWLRREGEHVMLLRGNETPRRVPLASLFAGPEALHLDPTRVVFEERARSTTDADGRPLLQW